MAWAWPVNRRIIYNRRLLTLREGRGDPKRAVIKWNPNKLDSKDKKPAPGWDGDVPDGPAPPMADEKGKYPFIMRADGMGAIFGPRPCRRPAT